MDQTYAIHCLLRSADGRLDAFDRALSRETERLAATGRRARVGVGLAHRVDEAVASGERPELIARLLDHGLLSGTVSVTAFDAVLEVVSDSRPGRDVLDGLADRFGDALDREQSTLHTGRDHVLMSGDGAIELFFGLRSTVGVTRPAFHEWWLHQLVAHTMHTPGKVGYRQVHADAALGAALAGAAGLPFDDLDGVAVEVYPDLTAFFRAIEGGNQPDNARTKTEKSMIDMARARAVVTRRTGQS